MEYLLGSIVTLAILFALEARIKSNPIKNRQIRYSQSHVHHLASIHVMNAIRFEPLETQATKYLSGSKKEMLVVLHDNDAYWIINNTLFTAKLSGEEIDRDSTKIVDTMAMDKVELNKLMIIVEKLTEGSSGNDNLNTGNQGLF